MFRSFRYACLGLIIILVLSLVLFGYVLSKVNNSFDRWFNSYFHQPKVVQIIPRPEKTVKIIEGTNDHEIAAILEKDDLVSMADFNQAIKADYSTTTYPFLADKPAKADLEGFLYPDTYRFYASTTATEVIAKMLDNFQSKLTPKMQADIKAQGKSLYQILIMASIVEKEAAIKYSQPDNNQTARLIAGIFWKRIQQGQRLQSCATLAYALGVNKEQYTDADTKIDSSYNTYLIPGLPPTPIANPGILAIEAAIYPLKSDYNYFLTPTGSQTMVFSKTYSEHLKNKVQYLGN